MKARLKVGQTWQKLEVAPLPATEPTTRVLRVQVDDREVMVDAVAVPGGVNLLVDGRVVELLVSELNPKETERQLDLSLRGTHFHAKLSEGHQGRISIAPVAPDAAELRAPMPGRVVRVLVEVGQAVTPGMPVIVVSAMKMENELTAPGSGQVTAVHVREEVSVERGALLVEFAPAESGT